MTTGRINQVSPLPPFFGLFVLKPTQKAFSRFCCLTSIRFKSLVAVHDFFRFSSVNRDPFPFLTPDSTKPPSVLCRPFPLPWKKTHHFFPAFSFLRVSCLVQNSQQRLTTTLEPSLRRTKSTNKEKSPPSLLREQKLFFFFFCIFFPCYSSPSFCLHKRKKERKKERKKRKKKISFRLFLSRLLILSTPLFFVCLSLSFNSRKKKKEKRKKKEQKRNDKRKRRQKKEKKEKKRKSTATSETQIKRKKIEQLSSPAQKSW